MCEETFQWEYIIMLIKRLNILLFSNTALEALTAHQIPMETEMSMLICNPFMHCRYHVVTMTSVCFPLNSCLAICSAAEG